MLQFIDRMGLAGEDFCQGWRIFIVINKKVSSSMSDSCSLKMPGFHRLYRVSHIEMALMNWL